jgi:hypothetical protein
LSGWAAEVEQWKVLTPFSKASSFRDPMPLTRATLQSAITASGGGMHLENEIDALLAKLSALEAKGRYQTLLKRIETANDKNNFLALVLEATFAYQFERAGLALEHEVKQKPDEAGSIDFALKMTAGDIAFFELRLLQQDQPTGEAIAAQLRDLGISKVLKGGDDEQKEVLRIQGTLLTKVENKNGQPIKFREVRNEHINLVAIAISDILLGVPDDYDCLLATCGDPAVPQWCKRGVFGVFQQPKPDDPEEWQRAAARFAHFRNTIHGVLFLFRAGAPNIVNYALEQVLVWNRNLIEAPRAQRIDDQIRAAIPRAKLA